MGCEIEMSTVPEPEDRGVPGGVREGKFGCTGTAGSLSFRCRVAGGVGKGTKGGFGVGTLSRKLGSVCLWDLSDGVVKLCKYALFAPRLRH
jgi:hypothetical protein